MYKIIADFGWLYKDNVPFLVVSIVAYLLAMAAFVFLVAPIHNNIQALLAYRCGDEKAKERCFSKNPLMSFNWIGTASALVLLMGFCEPIFVKRDKLNHPVFDTILIQLSGPVFYAVFSLVPLTPCLIMTYFSVFGIKGVNSKNFEFMAQGASPEAYLFVATLFLLYYLYKICFFSAALNLLPIPPLDTSRILLMKLSARWEQSILNNETIIGAGLVLILFLTVGKPGGVLYNLINTGVSSVYNFVRQIMLFAAGLLNG